MLIQEIAYHAGDSENVPMARFAVDGRDYLVLGGRGYVTVLTGKWINDRRALGKTFRRPQDLIANYKKDGEVVLEFANKVTNW